MAGPGPIRRLRDRVASSLGRSPADPDARIAVSYAPNPNGRADPGEVVWTWVPFEDDPTQGKDRPVLVLGRDGRLLVAVPMSSKDHADRVDAHEWVPLGSGPWDRSGRMSYADASRLLRVKARAVRREGAALPVDRFDAVVERVQALHGWQG